MGMCWLISALPDAPRAEQQLGTAPLLPNLLHDEKQGKGVGGTWLWRQDFQLSAATPPTALGWAGLGLGAPRVRWTLLPALLLASER